MHNRDTSDAFDILMNMTGDGERRALMAPYGPKPISLAMCIYAIKHKAPVYYTQPRAYHPEYSTGVSKVNSQPEIYAYCLRLEGKDLY